MTILDEIMAYKKGFVEEQKTMVPIKKLESSIYFDSPTVSLKEYITRADKTGIIAEFKRKSPSKGDINRSASVEEVSIGYMKAGASAISVLTDEKYFGGSNADLLMARKFNYCPILRKDFVLDEYQIIEAKSIGADAILLIAAAISDDRVKSLGKFAHSLGLEVLLEVHSEEELSAYNEYVDVLGVNNRDLKKFKTSINNSIDLYSKLPKDVVKISESGIHSVEDMLTLRKVGFDGFLIGESFMKSANPSEAIKDFTKSFTALS